MSKFRIEELDKVEWDELIEGSSQGTAFNKSFYLDSLLIPYQFQGVYRGDELCGGILLLNHSGDTQLCLHDYVIHGGIFLKKLGNQRKSKENSHQYEMICFLVSWLSENYPSISLAMSPEFKDYRPFLWHEYHNPDSSKKFQLDLRYTSRLDISNINRDTEICPIWNQLDTLRKRHIKQSIREQATFLVEPNLVDEFVELYLELMKSQGIQIKADNIKSMRNLMLQSIELDRGILGVSRDSNGRILYMTFWIWDKYRAYYLFGAGTLENQAKYQGTHCFWNSFFHLKDNYHVRVIDFEGVNSPQRGSFKMSFGGDLVPYYEVHKGR